MSSYIGNKFGQQDVDKLKEFEKRVDPNDKGGQALLEEMRQHVKKLEDMRKNEDPRLSFSTPEFKEAQRIFTDAFKKNFGKPVEWALVKDYAWSTPQLRKLDKPVDVDGKPWPLDANGNPILKKLIIMRHADSEDPKQLPGVRDHDRPITRGGRNAALDIAEQLASTGWLPEVLISSNAVRSRETLEAMREALPALDYADIHFLGSLYTISQLDGQTRAHLQEVVAGEAKRSHSCVLCLGHNKGWEEAATSYAGEQVKLGNCHAALLEGSGASWAEAFAEGAAWKLIGVLQPKEI